MCEDFDAKITKKQIETTQKKIDSGILKCPKCDTLKKDFDWDVNDCNGCARLKKPIQGLQLEDEKTPNLTTQIVEYVENLLHYLSIKEKHMDTIRSRDHFEIRPVRSKQFKGLLYEVGRDMNENEIPGSEAISNATNFIEVLGLQSEELEINNRVASHEDNFWYDLSNEQWSAVKISKGGWEIVDTPPALFKREQHQKAQVNPSADGGDVWELFDCVNVPENKKLLLLIWIIAAFIPDIPHPLNIIYGPPGAGKSMLIEFMSEIIDPCTGTTIKDS